MAEPNYHVEPWSGTLTRHVCDLCGMDSHSEAKIREHVQVGHGLEPVKGEDVIPEPGLFPEPAPPLTLPPTPEPEPEEQPA